MTVLYEECEGFLIESARTLTRRASSTILTPANWKPISSLTWWFVPTGLRPR